MKKSIASVVVALSLLCGGAITALASNGGGNNGTPNAGQYNELNKKIQESWSDLSDSQRTYYIQHPESAPTKDFPFGIDVVAGAPKGYPTCLPSDNPALYAPTVNVPPLCDNNDEID
jgi:hypothetical protein